MTAVLGVTNISIYQIPNVLYDGLCVYTNTTTAGAMRGFGNPQGNFAVESTVDMMAERLGMDPMELRLKNDYDSIRPLASTVSLRYMRPCGVYGKGSGEDRLD